MKKRFITLFFAIIVLGFLFQSLAQFTPEELAEREKWEEFLITAKIIKQEQPFEKREAVTEPWVLTLEKDGITNRALWKNPAGRMSGYVENWKWEIVAYRLDKYLGLNMVPATVERRFQENRGSCQFWMDDCITLRDKVEKKIKTPSYKIFPLNRAYYLQRAFDNLIANQDRHQNQFLFTKDWRMILIDHSRTFSSSSKYKKKLVYDEKYKEGPTFIMKELPRAFVEKLKSLNAEVIKEITEDYLTDDEIKFMLLRRDLIIKWLDKRIKKIGEDKVLY
ncbi:MAG: hypothetical protein JSV96_15925 [Candidatus Aminicenantes bacterium]|nr:MAG: hypothetical protein JSV96_15925 [Candidatus Aminicenantes bacterium]